MRWNHLQWARFWSVASEISSSSLLASRLALERLSRMHRQPHQFANCPSFCSEPVLSMSRAPPPNLLRNIWYRFHCSENDTSRKFKARLRSHKSRKEQVFQKLTRLCKLVYEVLQPTDSFCTESTKCLPSFTFLPVTRKYTSLVKLSEGVPFNSFVHYECLAQTLRALCRSHSIEQLHNVTFSTKSARTVHKC